MNPSLLANVRSLLRRWSYAPQAAESSGPEKRTILKIAYDRWMRFAKLLGKMNAVILLTLVYFILIGPAALVLKLLGKDLLDRKAGTEPTFWYPKGEESPSADRSSRQF